MASDKRNFSDFHKFPGEISAGGETKGWYVFPTITSTDSMGRNRYWCIYVRLIDRETHDIKKKREVVNWDMSVDIVEPIKKKYLDNGPVAANIIAQVWTQNGISNDDDTVPGHVYKSTRSIPTYIMSGKNIGKKNETTVFTQGLIGARSKYLKRIQKTHAHSDRFFPVAVHKYDASPRDLNKHIVYPVAVQRKLDGGRVVARWNPLEKKTDLYTRALKNVDGNSHIAGEMDTVFATIEKKYPGAYFDGEIYRHGMSLQKISGAMRRDEESKTTTNEEKNNIKKMKLEYHIFDVFFPTGSADMQELSQMERRILLDDIFSMTKKKSKRTPRYIKKVRTYIADTKAAETELYEQFLSEKYEGSIVKNLDAPYEFGVNREIRSYQMRKRKPRWSSEFMLVGYTEGTQGKDKGAIIWIMTTDPHDGILFNATPVGMDYNDRYTLWDDMTPTTFTDKWKGKMMTVEYDDTSEDGVPLRAKSKGIRLM